MVVVYCNLPNAYRSNQYNLYGFRFFRASVSVLPAHFGIEITILGISSVLIFCTKTSANTESHSYQYVLCLGNIMENR